MYVKEKRVSTLSLEEAKTWILQQAAIFLTSVEFTADTLNQSALMKPVSSLQLCVYSAEY